MPLDDGRGRRGVAGQLVGERIESPPEVAGGVDRRDPAVALLGGHFESVCDLRERHVRNCPPHPLKISFIIL